MGTWGWWPLSPLLEAACSHVHSVSFPASFATQRTSNWHCWRRLACPGPGRAHSSSCRETLPQCQPVTPSASLSPHLPQACPPGSHHHFLPSCSSSPPHPNLASRPTNQPLFPQSHFKLRVWGTRRAAALQLVGGSPIIFIQNEVLLKIKGTVDQPAQTGTVRSSEATWSPCSSTNHPIPAQ